MKIEVEISAGELLDKITILEIKSERIKDKKKLYNVRHELADLQKTAKRTISESAELKLMVSELKWVNETLWNIEDNIRDCEREKNFDQTFIELARSVYKNNDQRAEIKRQINQRTGSSIFEEKSYTSY